MLRKFYAAGEKSCKDTGEKRECLILSGYNKTLNRFAWNDRSHSSTSHDQYLVVNIFYFSSDCQKIKTFYGADCFRTQIFLFIELFACRLLDFVLNQTLLAS